MTDEDRIADLLMTWEQARERGDAITAEELCRGCPELLDAVRDRIRLLEKTAWMSGPAKPPQPRTLVERYVLEALIGSGGYADVWRAYDLRLHRHVAVKVPRPSRTLTALQIDEVLTEARQIACLKHVNVVTLHDVLKEGAGYVLVSDLIDGETLADRLRCGPMSPTDAVKVLAAVARAIDYAHGRGVVHRDLKPANILLDRAGTPHVGDFGLARPKTEFLEGSDQRGTLIYSSPEQLAGKPLDGRTDIWSLGIIMYEMLTGRPPFSDDTPVKLRQTVLAAQMPDARDVPAALRAICRRCLAVKPGERYAHAGDLADALETATTTQRSRWWLLPTALMASSLVGLAIYLSRPNEPKAKAEPDAPIAEKNGEVIPPKIEPKIDPRTEPIKEKAPSRPPARTLEGHTSAVRTVQVRAGGWIASTDEKTLRLWSPKGDTVVVDLLSPPTAEVFGHDGYSLFTGHEDGKLRQWWVGARTDAERAASWASWFTLPTATRTALSPEVADRPRPFPIRSWTGTHPRAGRDGFADREVVAWTTGKRLFVWDLVTNRAVTPQDKPDRPTVALFSYRTCRSVRRTPVRRLRHRTRPPLRTLAVEGDAVQRRVGSFAARQDEQLRHDAGGPARHGRFGVRPDRHDSRSRDRGIRPGGQGDVLQHPGPTRPRQARQSPNGDSTRRQTDPELRCRGPLVHLGAADTAAKQSSRTRTRSRSPTRP
ncbi:MAG: serine/threonine-protein kinase [Gemmataceae bacterium]